MRGFGSVASDWEVNTAKWGQPVWKFGYWFWDQSSIVNYVFCTPFGERSAACAAWNGDKILPKASVPPFLKDLSVVGKPSISQLDMMRAAVFMPYGVTTNTKMDLGTGSALNGKTYWSARKVSDEHFQIGYELARIVAATIGTAEANKIEAIDPSASSLVTIASLTDLTNALNPETKEGEELPFWHSPIIMMSGLGLMLFIMARKRRAKNRAKSTEAKRK